MVSNCYYLVLFRYFTYGTSDTFWNHPQRKKMALLAFALVAMLVATSAMMFVITGGGEGGGQRYTQTNLGMSSQH